MRFLEGLRRRLTSLNALGPAEPAAGWQSVTPRNMWLCAIGDVHGEAAKLDRLLVKVQAQRQRAADAGRETAIIFLGDLIDRGPDSRAVLERVATDPALADACCLMGNHEQSMLGFLTDPGRHRAWLDHGGRDTLGSFGILAGGALPEARLLELRDALAAELTAEQRHLLAQMRTHAVHGDYLFVHAGVRPGIPLAQQSADDMLWIREPFLGSRRHHGYRVVHGHTVLDAPQVLPNRVAIDTGAYAGGPLTAVILDGSGIDFLSDIGG